MARHNRIHSLGAVMYVVIRGRNGTSLPWESRDCERFESLVSQALVRCRTRLLAYCWLPNAAHLVVRLSDVALEALMRRICGPYSRYLHQERGWTGPVYQSRYRAIVIDPDLYLLPLLRYVHCLPVGAGLCQHPDDYSRSSHRAYRGGVQIAWLATSEVFEALHRRHRDVTRAYRALMSEPLSARITAQFERGSQSDPRIAGGIGFAGVLERKSERRGGTPTAETILHAVCGWQRIEPAALFARKNSRRAVLVRSLVAWHVLGCGTANLAQLARWWGVRRWTLRAGMERHRAQNSDLFDVPLEQILASGAGPSDEATGIGIFPAKSEQQRASIIDRHLSRSAETRSSATPDAGCARGDRLKSPCIAPPSRRGVGLALADGRCVLGAASVGREPEDRYPPRMGRTDKGKGADGDQG